MLNTKNKLKIVALVTGFLLGAIIFVFKVEASGITAGEVIDLANASRFAERLPSLQRNDVLDQVAMFKAQDMLEDNYFAHTSPQGRTPWYWFEKAGYDYKYAGENLAMGFQDAETEQRAWMESATHRQNILNPHYQEIGVAAIEGNIDGQLTMLVVQEFGSRLDFIANEPKKAEPLKPAKGGILGEENSVLNSSVGQSSHFFRWKGYLAAFKNKLDGNYLWKLINFGATGVLQLTIIGGFLVAGYLAIDSMVVKYLRRQKNKYKLIVRLLKQGEHSGYLGEMLADASKVKITRLR